MQKTTFNDFEILSTLGQGAFSTVFLVKRKKNQKRYALKSIKMEKLNKTEQANSVNEIRILSSINHPNIISYKESFWNENNKTLNIIMEYCDDGDLESKIIYMRRNKIKFKEKLIWSYIIQILFGLKTLHDKGVIHQDLKSSNIFLCKLNNKCKIGDFNTGKVIKKNKTNKNNNNYIIGTPSYFSPELCKNGKSSFKSDIWAFGCIIYEMCCLRMPFQGKTIDLIKENICKGKFGRISSRYSEELWEFIQTLLEVDIEKRPNCNDILENKIIKEKISKMSELNYLLNNEKDKTNDDESSITDTIEYKNLWDLENKIPYKKKYTKTYTNNDIEEKSIMDFDDTINNDSSFSEISGLDFSINNNNKKKTSAKNNSFKYLDNKEKKKEEPNKYNIIKTIKKDLIISNDLFKFNRNKSNDILTYIPKLFNLKMKNIGIKLNKSSENLINKFNSKKINQRKEQNSIAKNNQSELINIKKIIKKKENPKNLKTNDKINKTKKFKFSQSNKLNTFNKEKPIKINTKRKTENKKNIILSEKNIINITSKKNETKKYTYTNYKIYQEKKLNEIRRTLDMKIDNKFFPYLNPNHNTDKNLIININQSTKIKSLETSHYKIYKKQTNDMTFNPKIFQKKEHKFNEKEENEKNNGAPKINKYNTRDFIITEKKKKIKPNQFVKIIKIDLNNHKNKINLTKSLVHVNPFNKIYNKTYVSDISIKMKKNNNNKKNTSYSSKLVNICDIEKNKTIN